MVGRRSALLLGGRRLVDDPGAARHRVDLAVGLLNHRDLHDSLLNERNRLPDVVDDDVHQPGAKRAVLLRVVRFLVRHLSLLSVVC